jgi:flagellar protein FlgJ
MRIIGNIGIPGMHGLALGRSLAAGSRIGKPMNLGPGGAMNRAVESADKSAHSKELAGLKKACEQFEAVFAKQLLGEMRKGVKETPIGGDQAGSAIYKDMMDQSTADTIAHQGALGIGKMLYKQFEKQVAASSHLSIPELDPKNAAGTATPLQKP